MPIKQVGSILMSSNINWDEVIDKKARGIDDYDLGEVQEVNDNGHYPKGRNTQRQILSCEKTGRSFRWSLSVVI